MLMPLFVASQVFEGVIGFERTRYRVNSLISNKLIDLS